MGFTTQFLDKTPHLLITNMCYLYLAPMYLDLQGYMIINEGDYKD